MVLLLTEVTVLIYWGKNQWEKENTLTFWRRIRYFLTFCYSLQKQNSIWATNQSEVYGGQMVKEILA